MKKNKLTNKSNSTSRLKWFRIELIWGLALLLSIFTLGCEKEDLDEYYVKYRISSSSVNAGGKLNVTINSERDENISINIEQNTDWETIIGPVSKGFNAKIYAVNITGTDKLNVYSEIEVSKNNSPFAFKKSDGPQAGNVTVISMRLEYAIDF